MSYKQKIDAMLDYFTKTADMIKDMTSADGQLGRILVNIETASQISDNEKGAKVMDNFEIDPEDLEVGRD
jgi:hypothetical protein